jgi:hypothetical protein
MRADFSVPVEQQKGLTSYHNDLTQTAGHADREELLRAFGEAPKSFFILYVIDDPTLPRVI